MGDVHRDGISDPGNHQALGRVALKGLDQVAEEGWAVVDGEMVPWKAFDEFRRRDQLS